MKDLIIVYEHHWLLEYVRKKVNEVSFSITNTDKLESSIYHQLEKYFSLNKEVISKRWLRHLVDREIELMLRLHRIQHTTLYSDLAVTNDFGESLMYEPVDKTADVEYEVERKSLQRKIARLASDDFERYVLTAWSRGERSIDIAKDLAALDNRDVAYFKLKVARFKTRCKKRFTVESFA